MTKNVACRRWIVGFILSFTLSAMFSGTAQADQPAAAQQNGGWADFFSDCNDLLKTFLQQNKSAARSRDPQTSILVRVVDADENPISGVQIVRATLLGPEHDLGPIRMSRSDCPPAVTGNDGTLRIAKPAIKGDGLILTFKLAGYASAMVAWDNDTKIPTEFTCKLARSRPIGGVVRDDAGQPVAEATLELSLSDPTISDHTHHHLFMHEERTDAQGRWRCDHLPANPDGLSINVVHPEHVELPLSQSTCVAKRADLQALTAVFVMQTGLILEGRVTDIVGQPVAGACLNLTDRGPARVIRYPQATSDQDGRYRIANCPAGNNHLIVSAQGMKWQRREIDIRQGMAAEDFRLQPGHPIKIRVVDQAGQVVCHARIERDMSPFSTMPPINYALHSDEQGLWTSFGEPEGEVSVSISKAGYATVHKSFTAGDEVHTVVLPRPIHVVGRILDAESKQPLRAVHLSAVFMGPIPNPTGVMTHPSLSTDDQGRYELTFYDLRGVDKVPWQILAQFAGYATQRSRVYRTQEGCQTIDIEMSRGPAVAGIVQWPNGQAVAGANVFVSTTTHSLQIVNGRMSYTLPDACVCVKTGADGRFELPLPLEPYVVGVVHESGGAEIAASELAASGKIVLQPWAKVEGSVDGFSAEQKTASPASDVAFQVDTECGMVSFDVAPSVSIRKPGKRNLWDIGCNSDNESPCIDWTYQSELDEAGRFAFDRVLPGRREIAYDDTATEIVGDALIPKWRALAFNAVAGRSVHIDFARKGRPVGGLIELTEAEKQKLVTFEGFGALVFLRPLVSLPAEVRNMPTAEREAREKRWLDSEAGLAAARAGQNHTFRLAANGDFKADNVAPGVYQLVVDLHESLADQPDEKGERVGWLIREVVVPATESNSDAALDLGKLRAEATHIRHGVDAPDFEFQTADGRMHRLSDYRGKTVVLRFTPKWDDRPIWCGDICDDLDCFPELKAEITKRFLEPGHGGSVVWLNISSDTRHRPKVWTPQDPKLEYVQGHLSTDAPAWKAYDFARPCKEVQIAVSENGTVLTR